MSNNHNNKMGDAISAKIIKLSEMTTEADNRITSTAMDNKMGSSPTDVAYPVNFRLASVYHDDNAVLYHQYVWDSSTGIRGELGACEIKSIVHYPGGSPFNPSDIPPFGYWSWENPAILGPISAASDALVSAAYCDAFMKPYKAAEFTATQEFYYRQSWWPVDQFQKLAIKGIGDYIKIKRSVYQGSDGRWMYKIESTGGSVAAPI